MAAEGDFFGGADADALFNSFGGKGDEESDDSSEEERPRKRAKASFESDMAVVGEEEAPAAKKSVAVSVPPVASPARAVATVAKNVPEPGSGAIPVEGELPPSAMIAEVFVPKHNIKTDVAIPPGWIEPPPPPPREPARTYPFTLDPFQQKSIDCLEKAQSVLVAAHTSAGKTVIAEYAIAMSLRNNSRVIYTSPIKALSNQKYRDLYEIFQDVGLMTGDVTINPNASCLVMTTEILRSMLYRGSEIMREVAWVIFDEIHYMRDRERGVVWEETIILLPDTVKLAFLSATIPNAKEFAEWICKLHKQPCHVVYTDFRPTPLQHYIFPQNGEGMYLVVDEKERFREDNFQKAIAQLGQQAETGTGDDGKLKKRKRTKGPSDIYKIVKMVVDRHYDPVIIFSFSKRECEGLALQMSKLDFNDEEEKKMVDAVFHNAIDALSEDDQKLPQIEHILPLLKRGIGIHHSGLLPILKEVIEILFQEGLIKALFATETFSIGLNMPAKTVVFTNVRKFDGTTQRWVRSGEYIQMSGRAGRRGLDDRGIVILMVDEKMEPEVAKNMLKGEPDELISAFHVSYNMLLNMMRLDAVDPKEMLLKSFHQFQNEAQVPHMKQKKQELEHERDSIVIADEDTVATYYLLRKQLEKLREEMRMYINQPIYILPFLQPGRLVKVRDGDVDWGWGVVVNFHKRKTATKKGVSIDGEGMQYVVDVLLNCLPMEGKGQPQPCPPGGKGEMMVVPVLLQLLDGVSAVRIFMQKDLRPLDKRQAMLASVKEAQKRFPDGLPLLDPIENMNIKDKEFKTILRKIETLEDRLAENDAFKARDMGERFLQYDRKTRLTEEVKTMKKQIDQSGNEQLTNELRGMGYVLKRLYMIDENNVVQPKGRFAVEISAGDELLVTELIFEGVFNKLSVEQSVALLSCFVFEEKSEENIRLKESLAAPLRKLQEVARKIAKVMKESKLEVDVEEYTQKFKPHLMDVVHAWATGSKFVDICKMTDVFEGSLIRCFRRLEELLRQLCAGAKAIGDTDLENKFAEGITKIKRDIVFAASLYL